MPELAPYRRPFVGYADPHNPPAIARPVNWDAWWESFQRRLAEVSRTESFLEAIRAPHAR